MNTCSTCIYWHRGLDDADKPIEDDYLNKIDYMGSCRCPKMVYVGQYLNFLKDGLCYYDYEGAAAGVLTGEDFGCIHYKEKWRY